MISEARKVRGKKADEQQIYPYKGLLPTRMPPPVTREEERRPAKESMSSGLSITRAVTRSMHDFCSIAL